MKKRSPKMKLSRETIRDLSSQSLAPVAGGTDKVAATVSLRKTDCSCPRRA